MKRRKCDIPVPHQAANRRLHRWGCLRTQCKSTGCSTYMCHPAGSRCVVQRPTVVIFDTSIPALLSRNTPPHLHETETAWLTQPPLTHAVFKYSVHADRYTHTCTAEITRWRFTCVAAALPQTGCRDSTATNMERNDPSRCRWLHNTYS